MFMKIANKNQVLAVKRNSEMKQSMQIFTLVIFTLLFVFPPAAMSEVKVSLRNGKEIIADSLMR